MTLARVAARMLARYRGGQPGWPCDPPAAIPGPRGGWRTVTWSKNHPAAAYKPGESSCGDSKFLISSLHQTGQTLTVITQGWPTCRAGCTPLIPASQNGTRRARLACPGKGHAVCCAQQANQLQDPQTTSGKNRETKCQACSKWPECDCPTW